MEGRDILGAIKVLDGADLTVCDRDGLAGLVSLVQQARGWLDAFEIRVAARADELATGGACESAATLLADGGRRSARTAETAARRASMCSKLPALEQVARGGADLG